VKFCVEERRFERMGRTGETEYAVDIGALWQAARLSRIATVVCGAAMATDLQACANCIGGGKTSGCSRRRYTLQYKDTDQGCGSQLPAPRLSQSLQNRYPPGCILDATHT
jgi:hypothetical protein